MGKLTASEARLLGILQQNGRITNQELAEQAGMSASPCWRRVQALQDSGVIRRYVALVDPAKIGLDIIAWATVQLQCYKEDEVRRFEESVAGVPEIVECYSVMGEAEYVLKIMVTGAQDYDRFLHEFLFKIPGLVRVRSSLALREVKYTTALPLQQAAG